MEKYKVKTLIVALATLTGYAQDPEPRGVVGQFQITQVEIQVGNTIHDKTIARIDTITGATWLFVCVPNQTNTVAMWVRLNEEKWPESALTKAYRAWLRDTNNMSLEAYMSTNQVPPSPPK